MSELSEKPLVLIPGPAAVASGAVTDPEHRKAIRYPFTASAEIIEVFSQARVTGRTSDLGLGGCYIDTITPLTVGAVVRVRMERELRVFEAVAKVVYAHLSMAMGLAFTDIKPEYQTVLEAWMAELRGERLPDPDTATEREVGALSAVLNLRQVLNELINLMVRSKVINPNEGAALLRRMFQ